MPKKKKIIITHHYNMNSEDMIFQRDKNNNITSGGYKINSIFKKLDIPAIHGSVFSQKGGGKNQKGGNLQNLAVPMGLFFLQQGLPTEICSNTKKGKEIAEDLYSKLLTLAQDKKERKFNYSRKRRRRKMKNKTRKYVG